MASKSSSLLYQRIYSRVQQTPPGYVTTYGRIGQLVGCTARTVGFALAALPAGSDVPWQRVINNQGKVSPRSDGESNLLQRDLLEAEGIVFDDRARIDLNKYVCDFPTGESR